MTIKILFFGISTDLVGADSISFELGENSTIGSLKNSLKNKFEGLKNIYDFTLAINEEYATDDMIVSQGDIVAVIPPVSGG
jgi:molybdopterin converting factor subunit 1